MKKSNKTTTPSDLSVTTTSMLVSISDVVLNLIVAVFTGSQAVLAQSLQGLSDLVAAIILFIGVKRSKKSADERHPLGYGREIYFWVLIASLFMFVGTGVLAMYLGFRQFIDPGKIENVVVALAMLSFGLVTNFYAFNKSRLRLMSRQRKVKKSWKTFISSNLIETKATFLIDFLGTISAVFGLISLFLFVLTDNARFDGLGGILVGTSMMIAAVLLIIDVKSLIVGRTTSGEERQKIIDSALSHRGVLEVLDLRTLYLGSDKLLVLLEVHFDDKLSVDQIEKLSDKIKDGIKKTMPSAYHIQVEAETPDEELA